MRIMLVEDDYTLNKAIKNYLKAKDISVDAFYDGLSAYEALNNLYDVFLIDIDIPNINGIELLEQIKTYFKDAYVIMISATIEIDIIEKAYENGCNDYLKKPFSIKELELKLNILKKSDNLINICDGINYDSSKREIIQNDQSISLSQKEYTLLELLLKNRSQIVSKELIVSVVWDNEVDDGMVRKLVSRMNKKFLQIIIENRPKQGYIVQ